MCVFDMAQRPIGQTETQVLIGSQTIQSGCQLFNNISVKLVH